MTQEKLKNLNPQHLASYGYGLKVEHTEPIGFSEAKIIITEVESISNECVTFKEGCDWYFDTKENECQIKLLLRPLPYLIKEIEVDGQTIIPMVELAKIAGLDTTKYDLSSTELSFGIRCCIDNDDDDDKYEVLGFDTINGFGLHSRPSKLWEIVPNQLELWQLLFKLQFDVYELIDDKLALNINSTMLKINEHEK